MSSSSPKMNTQTSQQVRQAFLDFFAQRSHTLVSSSSLIPHNDPTLLFTNAGMNQFKDCFLGREVRPYSRAVSSQKCIRAGGKHNDLENVGYTARHHTFFEMLGNFSFGDYFKEEATAYAWEFVTKELALNKDRLWLTVYAKDQEAWDYWKKLTGFADHRIIKISTLDNFWSMGDTGPCGPCSEIFYDHGEGLAGGPPGSPEQDGDRFTEIWNLVFMQYDQQADGSRLLLPKPSIDTGMGLERVSAVVQGVHSNYDTDLFRILIAALREELKQNIPFTHPSLRVVVDHLRSTSFLIADGVLPSNEGRGYVLRRIMRRAMRHLHMLGSRDLLLHRLVSPLIGLMGGAYPELGRAEALIRETAYLEEDRFRQMLDRGLKLLREETGKLLSGQALPGETAFRLYDTYGFPLDLTQDILRGQGREVDEVGFEQAMLKQKELARKNWAGSGESSVSAQWFDLVQRLGATPFLGYQTHEASARIQEVIQEGEDVLVILDQTPFYGESGGQQGDQGWLRTADGSLEIKVIDTQKPHPDLIVHRGRVMKGAPQIGKEVIAYIDEERRQGLAVHHSAIHMMNSALKAVLGGHVAQRGSLVAPDRLRFDFTHPRAVTGEEMEAVEDLVNHQIWKNTEVCTHESSPAQALEAGAVGLFGEKYGDKVRVVSMGEQAGTSFSRELCGGTHVQRSGDIGFFKILSEGGLSAGVRRIEAVAGPAAFSFVRAQGHTLRTIAQALSCAPSQTPDRLKAVMEEKRVLELEKKQLLLKAALETGLKEDVMEIQGISLMILQGTAPNPKTMQELVGKALKRLESGIVVLISHVEDRVTVVESVSADLVGKISAVDLVRAAAVPIEGKGGGKPEMAQAGGTHPDQIPQAVEALKKCLQQIRD